MITNANNFAASRHSNTKTAASLHIPNVSKGLTGLETYKSMWMQVQIGINKGKRDFLRLIEVLVTQTFLGHFGRQNQSQRVPQEIPFFWISNLKPELKPD